uniref:NRAMP family divalent metal transporter n=1 Tax=Altererythrobacter segetis TaxID=1104773 RepID=UPI00140E012A|nr:divalent metal cation transporter [Altererythrobacter segetis]
MKGRADKDGSDTLRERLRRIIGPGLITGASDDDPSGIATYSQAGAAFGYALGWTLLLTYPLMAAVQMISARIGRTTGHGIAGNLRRYYPRPLLNAVVALLLVANTINIGADLGAMADATRLVLGGPDAAYLVGFAAFCAVTQVVMSYQRYVAVLKWLSLTLLAYVVTLVLVKVDWGEALLRLVVPDFAWSTGYLTTIVAVFGTTISPYLFFWQASEEAQDVAENPDRQALTRDPEQGEAELERIEYDTLGGMAASNLVALAIVFATAATLHGAGITDIQTSAQAAEALRPIAGSGATIIFALGIVGTGLLAVPVLAGSAAYALGEAGGWPVGLARKPLQAKAFYGAIVFATAVGMVINFTPINPIKALYWTAVINGVVAVPVMAIMMLLTARADVMGRFTVRGPLRWLGWLATAVMAAAVVAMALTSL